MVRDIIQVLVWVLGSGEKLGKIVRVRENRVSFLIKKSTKQKFESVQLKKKKSDLESLLSRFKVSDLKQKTK